LNNNLQKVKWHKLNSQTPNYFFVPKDFSSQHKYQKGFKIDELFNLNGVGICSKRDEFTIHKTKEKLVNTIKGFISLNDEQARNQFNLGKDTDWKIEEAKKDLTNNPDFSKITKINYRPFDINYTYYSNNKGFHARPVYEIMQHFTNGENIGLLCEKIVGNKSNLWNDVFITKHISDIHFLGSGAYVFPLYIYTLNGVADNDPSPYHKHHNLNNDIIAQIEKTTNLQFTEEIDNGQLTIDNEETNSKFKIQTSKFFPIDILDYIYAVLYSPAYRERYKEFLKIDFPRVPYPKDTDTFWQLVSLGAKLRQLHLMENIKLQKDIAIFLESGTNTVDKIQYNLNKVYINDVQYFDNVPPVAWNFYIGGYQPAQKWLKNKKNRTLTFDDLIHYQKIINILIQTDTIMQEINLIEN
jgi:predicted helicase